MNARDVVLGRIRTALGVRDDGGREVPREYAVRGPYGPGAPELLDLLADRLEDYRATVRRCQEDGIGAAVAEVLTGWGGRRVVVPAGLDAAWLAGWGGTVLRDDPEDPLPVTALDAVDGVVTGCAVAVAGTGTLALDGSGPCGRRAVSLVPDRHLVVVRAGQVVGTVPEGLARLHPHRPLTLVSGPSATSDIELDRVEGVHGPRTLDVVLVTPTGAAARAPLG